MANVLTDVSRDHEELYRKLQPLIWAWRGEPDKGVAFTNTEVDDATRYAGDFANSGTGQLVLRATSSASSITLNGSGLVLGPAAINGATITGNLGVTGTLAVTGATTLTGLLTANGGATLNGATITGNLGVTGTLAVTGATTLGSTLAVAGTTTLTGALAANGGASVTGDLAVTGDGSIGDDLTVGGDLTVNGTTNLGSVSFQDLVVNGHTDLGNGNGDTIDVIGVTTLKSQAGTVGLFWDPANSRVIVGSSTALGSATSDTFTVIGRSYFAPGTSNDSAIQVRRSNSHTVGWTFGVAADNDLVFKDDADTERVRLGDGASTYQLKVTGDAEVTGDVVCDFLEANDGADIEGTIDIDAASGTFRWSNSGNARIEVGATGIGFFGSAQDTRQTVVGSRGGNAALASLLSGLANLGLISDLTSA